MSSPPLRVFLTPTQDLTLFELKKALNVPVRTKNRALICAIDSQGNTLDFMLSAKRNSKAAKRFFKKVLKSKHSKKSRVINVDKDKAYPPAVQELKEERVLDESTKLRRVKYLNNRIEQDHRGVKKITKASLGYQSFHTAWRTIRGIETMHMINKGQVADVSHRDSMSQKEFVEFLFGIPA